MGTIETHKSATKVLPEGALYISFPVRPASAPFGGVKQSGIGHEGGRVGIEELVHRKNIYIPLD
jgi:aldehyde dehydrogenase (NAD+)